MYLVTNVTSNILIKQTNKFPEPVHHTTTSVKWEVTWSSNEVQVELVLPLPDFLSCNNKQHPLSLVPCWHHVTPHSLCLDMLPCFYSSWAEPVVNVLGACLPLLQPYHNVSIHYWVVVLSLWELWSVLHSTVAISFQFKYSSISAIFDTTAF